MHGGYARYSVDWVPTAGSALAEFGYRWCGWCAERGSAAGQAEVPGVFGREVPGQMAMHGLHLPLSGPITLPTGRSIWALEQAVEEVAGRVPVLGGMRLELGRVDRRVALCPVDGDHRAGQLSVVVGTALSAFLGEASGTLAALPLTDAIDDDLAGRVERALAPRLSRILEHSFRITELALMGDPGDGRPWRLLDRYPLALSASNERGAPSGMGCSGPRLIAPLDCTVP